MSNMTAVFMRAVTFELGDDDDRDLVDSVAGDWLDRVRTDSGFDSSADCASSALLGSLSTFYRFKNNTISKGWEWLRILALILA